MAHCKFATAAADIPKRATGADTAYSRTYCVHQAMGAERLKEAYRGVCVRF